MELDVSGGGGTGIPADSEGRSVHAVVAALYRVGTGSVQDLAAASGVSRITVLKILRRLDERSGLVESLDELRATRGRPATVWRIRDQLGYLVAIDVGPTTVRVRVDGLRGPDLSDAKDAVTPALGSASAATLDVDLKHDTPVDRRVEVIDQVLADALHDAGIDESRVWSVCVVTPGIVDDSGEVVACTVIDGWTGDVLRRRLSHRFPSASVAVENDGNAAAIAEAEFGAGRGVGGEIVCVYVGRRLGLGIVRDGRIHRGRRGRAGEVGNLSSSTWKPVVDWLSKHDGLQPGIFDVAVAPPPSGAMDAELVQQVSAESRSSITEFARLCAVPVAEQTFTFDPDLIVLGGPLTVAGDTFLRPFTDELIKRGDGSEPVAVASSPLGRDGVLLGASARAHIPIARMLLERAGALCEQGRRS